MPIKLDLSGVEHLLDQIAKAQGNVTKAAEECIRESAEIMEKELKAAMRNPKEGEPISNSLINRMPKYTIEGKRDRITAHVGYKAESYNPSDLSDYHKAVFANYGTPFRKSHGQVKPRHFVEQAKKAADSKIKAVKHTVLQEILIFGDYQR